MLENILAEPPAAANHGMEHRQILIGDKNYFGHDFETRLDYGGNELLCPARKGEKPPTDTRFFKFLRQVIESINWPFKGHFERHAAPSPASAPE